MINKSNVPWTDYNCNIYSGCSHNCTYCYARRIARKSVQQWHAVKVRKPLHRILTDIRKEAPKTPPGRIMLCSMCDPYQRPAEIIFKATRTVLTALLNYPKFQKLILTKSDLVMRDYPIFTGRTDVEIGFTFTCTPEKINPMEPHAPPPAARFTALQRAHDLGIKTFISLEPIIPKFTDVIAILRKLDPYVDRWILGKLNYHGDHDAWYRKRLPKWINFLDRNGMQYYIKPELEAVLQ